MITFDDFAKVELRVGTVLEAADTEDGPVFLTVPKKVPAGTKSAEGEFRSYLC